MPSLFEPARNFRLLIVCCMLYMQARSQSAPPAGRPCGSPIFMPIRNMTTKNGQQRRGIQSSIGTPAQNLTFGVAQGKNSIYVLDSGTKCSPNYTDSPPCEAAKGGFFNSGDSQTWKVADRDYVKTRPTIQPKNGGYGFDVAHLGETFQFDNLFLGFTRTDDPDIPYSLLGLGFNSTMLSDLLTAGSIPSRTWAYYHGIEGSDPSDGSLILGGYSPDVIANGSNMTVQSLALHANDDNKCTGLQVVTISDIRVSSASGTSSVLKSNATAAHTQDLTNGFSVATSIDDNYVAELPEAVINQLLIATGLQSQGPSTTPLNYGQIRVTGTFEGNVTFILNDGQMEITIPSSQLLGPEYIVKSGQDAPTSSSNQTMRIAVLDSNPDVGAGQCAGKLGAHFFSSAYFINDLDQETFTIGQAQPSRSQSQSQNLIPIPGKDASTCINSSSQAPSAPVPSSTASKSKPISGGAIAGIVIAVLIGLSLLGLAAFLLYRRRNNSKKSQMQPINQDGLPEYSEGNNYEVESKFMAEMPSADPHTKMPFEMSGYSHTPEVAGEEIRTELPSTGIGEYGGKKD